jgi:hypothetical protein
VVVVVILLCPLPEYSRICMRFGDMDAFKMVVNELMSHSVEYKYCVLFILGDSTKGLFSRRDRKK